MSYVEMILGSMVINNLSSIKTGVLWIDAIMLIAIVLGSFIVRDINFTTYVNKIVANFFLKKNQKKITFMFRKGEQSNRCKGLFHFLSKKKYVNSNINNLVEDIFKKYDYNKESDQEFTNIYRVNQFDPFNFTETIKGNVYTEERESIEYNGKVTHKEFIFLVIYSEVETLTNIQEFVDNCKKEYDKFIKDQMLDQQYLITIENSKSTNTKENDVSNLKITKEPWSSNVTFDSRFFPSKEKNLETIEHFIRNKQWYKDRGLNHTLGILLSGDPGCGKTSFIKALLNQTGRHCIEVKLSEDFNCSELKDIVFNEEIDDDIIIPQDRRIIVFEDIDAMGSIVKDRDLKEKENSDAQDKIKDEIINYLSFNKLSKDQEIQTIKDKVTSKENNNLSYFLNILDGINETPGRIIIMTTNKPHVLDSALIRPGRIDMKINFTFCNVDNLKRILNYFWDSNDEIEEDLNKCDGKLTPAEVIDICRNSKNKSDTIKRIQSEIVYD